MLENQEDYRYCPLSLLESIKAVVNALAEGRIAPFIKKQGEIVKGDKGERQLKQFNHADEFRYAPSFIPSKTFSSGTAPLGVPYTDIDIARYLGRATSKNGKENSDVPHSIRAALNALYLLEVRAIKTSDIKDMNWSQLGKFVADIKATTGKVGQLTRLEWAYGVVVALWFQLRTMQQRERDMCVAVDLGVADAFEKLVFCQTEAEKFKKKLERGVFRQRAWARGEKHLM